jgi:hypothetical protein
MEPFLQKQGQALDAGIRLEKKNEGMKFCLLLPQFLTVIFFTFFCINPVILFC